MDGRRAGAQLDGVIAVFLHDFRLLQLQFLCARHHDAIAGGLDLLERGLHLVIKLFRLRKFPQHLHERFVIGNLPVHENGKLPVVNFAAGGVATPADAALMMQLGAEGVFVGSGIFKSGNPAKRAAAIVKAVTNYTDAKLIAELSEDLGEAMVGINEQEIALLMAERGK